MDIMGMVTIFVAVAIILGIAVVILGNTSSSINCAGLETTWQTTCTAIQTQSQNSFNLLLVVLIVIAAVIILAVVRML